MRIIPRTLRNKVCPRDLEVVTVDVYISAQSRVHTVDM